MCGPQVAVGPGDTLSRIAARCATTVTAILRMNPQIADPDVIRIGQVIHLAPGSVARPGLPQRPEGPRPGYYVVRPGDTLYRIAFYVGVPVQALLAANPHIDPRFLQPGMTIRLPGRGVVAPPRPMPPRPQAGGIAVTGIITEEGATCPAMRGSDGRLYTLVGDVGGVAPGDRVRVQGRIARASVCMQGTTIEVHRLQTLGGGGGDDADRPLAITGVVTDEGVECTAIRGSDGRLYTLAGHVGGLKPGDRVQVLGRRAEVSFCMQGITIEVERLRRLS